MSFLSRNSNCCSSLLCASPPFRISSLHPWSTNYPASMKTRLTSKHEVPRLLLAWTFILVYLQEGNQGLVRSPRFVHSGKEGLDDMMASIIRGQWALLARHRECRSRRSRSRSECECASLTAASDAIGVGDALRRYLGSPLKVLGDCRNVACLSVHGYCAD